MAEAAGGPRFNPWQPLLFSFFVTTIFAWFCMALCGLVRIRHHAVRGEHHRVGVVRGQQRVDDVLRGERLRLRPDAVRGDPHRTRAPPVSIATKRSSRRARERDGVVVRVSEME